MHTAHSSVGYSVVQGRCLFWPRQRRICAAGPANLVCRALTRARAAADWGISDERCARAGGYKVCGGGSSPPVGPTDTSVALYGFL